MFDSLRNLIGFNWFTAIVLNNSTLADWMQVFLSLASMLIALATFFLAKKVQKAIASNHAKQKQVEAMCELVDFLNNTRIRIVFVVQENMRAENDVYYNLFEIGYLTKFDVGINWEILDNNKVYLSQTTDMIVDVCRFVNNPFIPHKIADKLMNFYVYSKKEPKKLDDSYVLICSAEDSDFHVGKEPHCFALKDWGTLKAQSLKLTEIISEWFREYEIYDFNIRLNDYKYYNKL